MDFKEGLKALSSKIKKLEKTVITEEAAKMAFVLPFIKALGYDHYDPDEVIPEHTIRVGVSDVKCDYVIEGDGKKRMLCECKKPGADLKAQSCWSQVATYFQMIPEVRIGILTDGIKYIFYSDIDKPNVMDKRPFLEIDMREVNDNQLFEELRKFTKSTFDIEKLIDTATELMYAKEIKRILIEEFDNPSKDFINILANKLSMKARAKSAMEQFTKRVKSACSEFINERINERLKAIIEPDPWNEERTRATWDLLPSYPSEKFTDYLNAKAMTLEQFKKMSVYTYGIKYGIIKEQPPKPNGPTPTQEFFEQLLKRSNERTELFKKVSAPSKGNWVSAGAGKAGIAFIYAVSNHSAKAQLTFWSSQDHQLNQRRFESIWAKKNEIEASFGESLEWDTNEAHKFRYVQSNTHAGGLLDREKWPLIHGDLVDRMARLEKALRPHLAALA